MLFPACNHVVIQPLPDRPCLFKTRLYQTGDVKVQCYRRGHWTPVEQALPLLLVLCQLRQLLHLGKPLVPVLNPLLPRPLLCLVIVLFGERFNAWVPVIKTLVIRIQKHATVGQ